MKIYLITFLLLPFLTIAQRPLPYLEGDTLYTSCGFKIYKGQTLQIAKGTGNHGDFRFVYDAWNIESHPLTNATFTIKEFRDYKVSGLGNVYVWMKVHVVFPGGSTANGQLKMNVDKAIQPFAGLPSEIIIPKEFQQKLPAGNITEELEKLMKMYQDSLLTKEEFEAAKKKLLNK